MRSLPANGALYLGTPKTTQSVRSLDAPAIVIDALQQRQHTQRGEQAAAGPLWNNLDNLVWTNSVGSPTDPSRTRHAFIRTARAAHLDASWTPNSLRHTTASILSDAGAPLEDIADQLGHKDTRMAALHYRHRIQPTIATGLLMADTIATDNPRRTNEHPSTLSTR